MSVHAQAWAYDQKTGSPTRKAVLLALADRVNRETRRCDPLVETVAEQTELSERTVRRALDDLTEAGFLTRERKRRQDGTLGGYRYFFPEAAYAPRDRVSEPPDTEAANPEDTVAAQEPGSKPLTGESTTDVVLSRDDVGDVFAYWQTSRSKPRAKLTPNRRKKIEARLREFTFVELKLAIDGVGRDPWKDRHLHDDLTIIFRNREQVEKFVELGAGLATNGRGTSADAYRLLQEHRNRKGAPR